MTSLGAKEMQRDKSKRTRNKVDEFLLRAKPHTTVVNLLPLAHGVELMKWYLDRYSQLYDYDQNNFKLGYIGKYSCE